jgi:hypothetical protein
MNLRIKMPANEGIAFPSVSCFRVGILVNWILLQNHGNYEHVTTLLRSAILERGLK